eukprot:122406_1
MNELTYAVNKLIQFHVDLITDAVESDEHDHKLDPIIVMGQASCEILGALLHSKTYIDHVDSELKRRIQLIVSDKYYINSQRILRQEKYKYIQTIFEQKCNHSQFISLFHLLENNKSTEKLPFCINKTISEFANGNVYFCSNLECNEEILLLMSESGKKYDNYCAVFDKYWCRKCAWNLIHCSECSAIQWKSSAVECMNDDCENEGVYLCQNTQCSNYRDKAKGCTICDGIICGGYHDWTEFDLAEIVHCIQCKQLCCNQCSNICTICNKYICAFCVHQYELECKSTKCKSMVMNHPSCEKYCNCERNQSEYCHRCITHSCEVGMKCVSGTHDQECGSSCKICLSEK